MDLVTVVCIWTAVSFGTPVVVYTSNKLSRKLLSSRTPGRRFDDIKN